MGNKLYVGNLAYSVRDDTLLEAFSRFGRVTSAKVMVDRETGRSKGFGFVEMSTDSEAQRAIEALKGDPESLRVDFQSQFEPLPPREGYGFERGEQSFRSGRVSDRERTAEPETQELTQSERDEVTAAIELVLQTTLNMNSNMDKALGALNRSIDKLSGEHA